MAWHSTKPSCPNWGWADSRGGGEGAGGGGGSEEVLFLNSHHGRGAPDNNILAAPPAAKPPVARDALAQQPQRNASWILHQAHGPSLYAGNGGDGPDTEVCNGHGLDAGINAAFAAASPSTTLAVGGHGDPSSNLPFWDYGASHGTSKDWCAGSKIGILDFKHDSAHGGVVSEHDVVDAKENALKEGDIEFLKLRSHHGSSSLGQWKPVSTGTQQQGSPIVEEVNGKQSLPFLPHAGAFHDTSATQSSEEQHSSTATGSAGSGDSLTGLHLGKRNHDGDATVSTVPRRVQNPAQSNPVPSKKQRASSVALQTPRCQVQGCNLELTNAKAYHKRHKVCDAHSKAEKVVVANLEQRFCQQCSRFHVLAEFDEVKRSCRKRLAGHNERRRKPQPEALALNARLSSIFRDWPFYPQSRLTGMSSLWGDPGESSSLFFRGSWPKTVKLEDQQGHNWAMQASGIEKEMFYTGSSPHFGEKSPLLLLHSPKGMMSMPNDSQGQRFSQYLPRSFGHGADGSTFSSSSGAGALSSLEAAPATQAVTRVTDSGCALSLLSVQTQGSHVADAVSLGLSTGASLPVDSSMNDNILSIAFNSRKDLGGGSNGGMEKDQIVNSFIHGFNGVGCLQSLPLYPTLRGQETKVLQASRSAVEVMQIMPLSQPYGQAMGFQMPFGDLPYSDESSLMELQQRI